jgi:membrane fusion protein, multidrug efflux system
MKVATIPLKAKEAVSVAQPAEGAPSSAAQPVPARPARKRGLLVVGAFAALALAIFGTRAFLTHGTSSTDDAQVEADVVAVASEVGGRVADVFVRDNQAVKKGDVLFEIDGEELLARLDQAKAEVATASAELHAAQAQERIAAANAHGGFSSARAAVSGSALNVSSAGARIRAAEASVARAEAEATRAKLELSRSQSLFAQSSIAKEQLDNSKLASDSAEAALTLARAELSSAQDTKRAAETQVVEARGRLAQSAPVDAQIAVAEAASELAAAHLQAAQAKLALSELALKKAKVVASTDGTLSRLSARPGQLLAPNQPVAELVPSQAYVIANFKETELAGIAPGKVAEVNVDAYPGRSLHGTVESLASGTGARFSLLPPDNASGNFVKVVQRVPVRIALDEAPRDMPLQAGLSAEVTVHTR